MQIPLPGPGKAPVRHKHFPTAHQAFIFRASEFVSFEKIAAVLRTDVENVVRCARQMGIDHAEDSRIWLEKGYVSIIRALWHILPYEQLTELLETDEAALAMTLREEDFLDIKLGKKPVCDRVCFRELTPDEEALTKELADAVKSADEGGVKPFDFRYVAPEITFSGKPVFDTRMIYLFSGLYQTPFDVDSETYCTDEMLESYRRLGINGVWTQGILFRLTRFPFAPEMSEGWEKRLENMKRFAKRLAGFGIKLYIYLNEPRPMTHAFFEKYPHLRGAVHRETKVSLCTSTPEVRNYIRDAVETVCRAVPEIGGFFTITRAENQTNCYSHAEDGKCGCPRCSKRPLAEVIAEVNSCIREGADRVDPGIKVFAWSWNWTKYSHEIIKRLPERVILLSQSERDVPFEIGGVKGHVEDYSMGQIGPGELAVSEWALAGEKGLETAAKVQVNTTWEGSTVPALPLSPLIEEHLERLRAQGVRHLLLSWTLGGFPSENLIHAAKYYYENVSVPEEAPEQKRACELFSKAFREFPFHIQTLYHGPQNAGPANLLWDEPTGYGSTMTCFAYDDLDGWHPAEYPEDVFVSQLAKLCSIWEQGLELIKDAPETETALMARAAYCLYRSSLDQARFIRARRSGDRESMISLAAFEEQTARDMLSLMNKNAAVGFEAANQYYFTKRGLVEKIACCKWLRKHL